MKIKWLGHACFLITSEKGTRIVTDPFDSKVGYVLPELTADIVTVSHGHHDHNNVGAVKGDFLLLDKAGDFSHKGVDTKGVQVFHDEEGGSRRGKNIIFKLTVDGVRVCHCGDLGHVLSDEQLKKIGEVDVLLLPVGGVYTVDAEKAFEVKKQFKPILTIPMHFKTDALTFSLDGVQSFLDIAGEGKVCKEQEVEVTRDKLQELAGILVLDYK